jgi:hypothetical protein
MRNQVLVSSALLILFVAAARADRPVTDEERAKLLPAIAAAGCTGGTLEVDDDKGFEVENVRCSDGQIYDLEFDKEFRLNRKKLDD